MHEIVETNPYLRAAKIAKVSDDEMAQIVDYIAENPDIGEIMVGSGGCRKVRFARKGKGKSGGYRIVTYYSDLNNPVFLLWIFAKNRQENLNNAQITALSKSVKELIK